MKKRIFALALLVIFATQPLAQRPVRPAAEAGQRTKPDTSQQQLQQCQAQVKSLNDQLAKQGDRLSDYAKRLQQYESGKGADSTTISRLRNQIESLNGQINQLKAQIEGQEKQITGYQARLKQYESDRGAESTALSRLRVEYDSLSRRVESLKSENTSLSAKLSGLNASLASTDQQINNYERQMAALLGKSRPQVSDLPQQISGLLNGQRQNFLADLQRSREEAGLQPAPSEYRYEQQHKVHIIRDLVVGLLDLEFEKELKAKVPSTVKATFKPRPISTVPGAAEGVVWKIKLAYKPEHAEAKFNIDRSGGNEERRLPTQLNDQAWVWSVTQPEGFRKDKGDVAVSLGYDEKPLVEVGRQSVEYGEMTEPGLFSAIFRWLKENFSWLLGTVTLLLGIWLAWLNIKKGKIEVEKVAIEREKAGLEKSLREAEVKIKEMAGNRPPSSATS